MICLCKSQAPKLQYIPSMVLFVQNKTYFDLPVHMHSTQPYNCMRCQCGLLAATNTVDLWADDHLHEGIFVS